MKIVIPFCLLLCCAVVPFANANAQTACVSEIASIEHMQKSWNAPSAPMTPAFSDDIAPSVLQLQPMAQAEQSFGALNIKSRKKMQFFNQYAWTIATEGDYWVAADSGVWIDVREGKTALDPLTFNHGLRCAGIYKALKFHLAKGRYVLLIASDETDKVKIIAEIAR